MKSRATVDDLYRVPDKRKAELVGGKLILLPLSAGVPARASGAIFVHLREFEQSTRHGYAFLGNLAYLVNLPNRGSFSPDAGYYVGQLNGCKFLDGAPIFAAEVRSENDYSPA